MEMIESVDGTSETIEAGGFLILMQEQDRFGIAYQTFITRLF